MSSLVGGPNASPWPLPEWAERSLTDWLDQTGIASATVTSAFRSPEDQARAMYQLIQKKGFSGAYALYGRSGRAVLDSYSRMVYANDTDPGRLQAAMAQTVRDVGPANVSVHCDPGKLVVDVDPSSIPAARRAAFVALMDSKHRTGEIGEWYHPGSKPSDPAFHIQLMRPDDSQAVTAAVNAAKDVEDVFGGGGGEGENGNGFWKAAGVVGGLGLLWWLLS